MTKSKVTKNPKQELINRTKAIHSAMANGTLHTKEDAQQLLKHSKQPIRVINGSVAIDKYRKAFSVQYENLNKKIKLLQGLIARLPTKEEVEQAEQTQVQQQQDNHHCMQAELLIRHEISEFTQALEGIDDSNDYKKSAQALKESLNNIVKAYCEDKVLTKNAIPAMQEEIAKTVAEAKPTFKPEIWHPIADLGLRLLNALKAVVRGVGIDNQRFKLFSEQAQENKVVKDIVDNLTKDVENAEPVEAETCEL